MTIREFLKLTDNDTKIQLVNEKGIELVSPVYKKELTVKYINSEVEKVTMKRLGKGLDSELYLSVTIK